MPATRVSSKKRKLLAQPAHSTTTAITAGGETPLAEEHKDLIAGVLEKSDEIVVRLICEILNRRKISTDAFAKARINLPSFPGARWSDLVRPFNLPINPEFQQLAEHVTPMYCLPPPMHETMYETAWHTNDVYQERHDHAREAPKIRFLDSVRQLGFL